MQLARLFDYDLWANRAAIASVAAASQPPPRVLAVTAHIVAAECLWWARVQGETARFAVWPTLSIDQCDAEMLAIGRLWQTFVKSQTAQSLLRPVTYTNSKGEAFDSAVEDILLHVVFHSAHHRGQIASGLRVAGFEPAYTDYIHARRQGHI